MSTSTRPQRRAAQRAKGPVEPGLGQRVRALRESRGLTQAALAGADFSKAFISLIETGRTRISLRAAGILAARLGVPVSDLLQSPGPSSERELELLITRAEILFRAGDADAAGKLADSATRSGGGLLKARAQRVKAHVLMHQQRAREALTLLDTALRTFRASRERALTIRTLFDLARAHSRVEERGEALNLALEVERALASGEVVDRTLELQVLCFIAAMYVTLGDYGSADVRTERAQALAADITDPRAVAQLYESLAITRQEQGDLEAALTYATKALRAYEELGDRALVGSAWNTIGWVLVQREQFGRAREALDRAHRVAEELNNARLRGYVLQTRGELELARGHATEALQLANDSIAVEGSAPRGRALSLLVKAQALAATGAPLPAVNAAFEAAFEALSPCGRRQLARAHELHFQVLIKRERYKEAAASAQRALELTHPSLTNR